VLGEFAVYDHAYYCPEGGGLAPGRLAELIRGHRERLDADDALPADQRQGLMDAGVLTVNHEVAVKDGFAALETYLKDRFMTARPRATFLANRPGRQDLGWACRRGCLCSHAQTRCR